MNRPGTRRLIRCRSEAAPLTLNLLPGLKLSEAWSNREAKGSSALLCSALLLANPSRPKAEGSELSSLAGKWSPGGFRSCASPRSCLALGNHSTRQPDKRPECTPPPIKSPLCYSCLCSNPQGGFTLKDRTGQPPESWSCPRTGSLRTGRQSRSSWPGKFPYSVPRLQSSALNQEQKMSCDPLGGGFSQTDPSFLTPLAWGGDSG